METEQSTTDQHTTLEGARAASLRGELGVWVKAFLSSDGSDNAKLAEELAGQKESWHGPVKLPFDELHRLAGPPSQPTLDRLDDDDLETVEGMAASIADGWQPPPVIVSCNGDQLVVEDGNHRIEGLRRAGHADYWAIIGFENDGRRDDYVRRNS